MEVANSSNNTNGLLKCCRISPNKLIFFWASITFNPCDANRLLISDEDNPVTSLLLKYWRIS